MTIFLLILIAIVYFAGCFVMWANRDGLGIGTPQYSIKTWHIWLWPIAIWIRR